MQICLWKPLMPLLNTTFNLAYKEGHRQMNNFCLGLGRDLWFRYSWVKIAFKLTWSLVDCGNSMQHAQKIKLLKFQAVHSGVSGETDKDRFAWAAAIWAEAVVMMIVLQTKAGILGWCTGDKDVLCLCASCETDPCECHKPWWPI